MKRNFIFSLVLMFAFGMTANIFPVGLHRYHASLTRMDYNSEKKLVEISIQLFTHDLVPVLEKQNRKQIDLEKTKDIDDMLLDYLSRNFILKNKSGEVQKLQWVGKEIEVDTAYIYVEIPMSEGLEGSSMQNTIFFETFAEQTNRVTLRRDTQKTDLLFVGGDNFKEIKFEPSKDK